MACNYSNEDMYMYVQYTHVHVCTVHVCMYVLLLRSSRRREAGRGEERRRRKVFGNAKLCRGTVKRDVLTVKRDLMKVFGNAWLL